MNWPLHRRVHRLVGEEGGEEEERKGKESWSWAGEHADRVPIADVKTIDDLVGPGAKAGTVPTDMEQSTGMERLEILGKMEGVDIFDMRPLDASRKGTLAEPILVRSAGEEQFAGCTGYPADSHGVIWLTVRCNIFLWRCDTIC